MKASIRADIRAELELASADARKDWSAKIIRRIQESLAWQRAKAVLLFWPLTNEPEIFGLAEDAVAAGKPFALPRFVDASGNYEAAIVRNPEKDLVVGRFGAREPGPDCSVQPLNQLDFALVPGIAFDAYGGRLGRGRGYYDRLLTAVRGIKCGVAFDCQIVARIPEEPHDMKLDCLVTPTRWLEFSAARGQ